MKPLFSRSIKAGLLAIGLSAGLSLPALAGLMPQPIPSVPGVATSTIVPVRDSWAGGNDNRVSDWRWRKRHHSRHRHWRGPRHYQHRRHYRRNWHGGSGFFLGFGLGAPYYRDNYYRPRYRVYRGGNAHVRWCYAHYRSYRASDNTFQPYNGRRRQCRSPY